MKNSPKSVIKGWAALSVFALGSYLVCKDYTLARLKEYTKHSSVTSSGKAENDATEVQQDGKLRRSVNRSLS
ncbi:hypothetical protein G6F37_009967 [Rhizopus arrhizus]|nr:hypothetical protein G6F38_007194 [Rhizopus arrhizus]KAG1153867.1 hypothetical protein G6F37_009967 [Rhizopus arrhizus]